MSEQGWPAHLTPIGDEEPVVLATFPRFKHTSPELEVAEVDGRWRYVERETQ